MRIIFSSVSLYPLHEGGVCAPSRSLVKKVSPSSKQLIVAKLVPAHYEKYEVKNYQTIESNMCLGESYIGEPKNQR